MDDAYFIVHKWMHTDLKLKGSELLVFAIVYGFSYNGENTYNGSLKWIAETAGISKRQAINTLKSLVNQKLLQKTEIFKFNVKFCEYSVNNKEIEKRRYEAKIERRNEKIENTEIKVIN